MSSLSHVDEQGRASMVDVSAKAETDRVASASAFIALLPETMALIAEGKAAKGDVIAAARIAGIMAAKKTPELIPLCHTLMLSQVTVEIAAAEDGSGLAITATAKTRGQTGVEMEALTAASVAALTIYDMVKAVDRAAVISDLKVTSKSGGKSDAAVAEEGAPTAKADDRPGLVSRGFRRAPGGSTAARPRTIEMGTVTPAALSSRVESFRNFLREGRLQVSAWAAQDGLPPGLVYGFMHGRLSRLPRDAEEKLAKAANSTVRDIFGSD